MGDMKSQNEKKVSLHLLVTLVPLYISLLLLHWDSIISFIDSSTAKAIFGTAILGIGPIAFISIILNLFLNNISTVWKERISHLRWNNPLPACRSHLLIKNDPRVYIEKLKHPEIDALLDLSLDPRERNSLWYNNIYKPNRDNPAISNTSKRYLLYRESAAGACFIMLLISVADLVARCFYGTPLMHTLAYLSNFMYLALLIGAANSAGNRVVTNAIANHIK